MHPSTASLGRRAALAALGTAALARPAPTLAQPAAASRTLRYVPHANLANLDPVWCSRATVPPASSAG